MTIDSRLTTDQVVAFLGIEPARFRFLEAQCQDFLSSSVLEFPRRYSRGDVRILSEANHLLNGGVQATELRKRVARLLANPSLPRDSTNPLAPVTRLIAVASGKGGVGKSNVALNLSVELIRSGIRTLLLDADLGVANLHLMAGLYADRTLRDVISGQCSMEDVIVHSRSGLDIVPGSSGIYEMANLAAYNRSVLISEFRKLETQYAVMIIDTAAGVAASVIDFIASSDFVLVITTPEATSITDAYALIKLSLERNPACSIGVVANRVRSAREGNSTVRRISNCTQRFLNRSVLHLGCIWEDSHVRRAVNEGVPLSVLFPESRASMAVRKLARVLRETGIASPIRKLDRNGEEDPAQKSSSLPVAVHATD